MSNFLLGVLLIFISILSFLCSLLHRLSHCCLYYLRAIFLLTSLYTSYQVGGYGPSVFAAWGHPDSTYQVGGYGPSVFAAWGHPDTVCIESVVTVPQYLPLGDALILTVPKSQGCSLSLGGWDTHIVWGHFSNASVLLHVHS